MLMSIPQRIILEIPDTTSQWQHIWFLLSICGNSSETLHCGNVINMPYSKVTHCETLWLLAVHTPGILSLLRIDGSVLWSWLSSSSRMRSVIIVHARCRGSTRGRSRRGRLVRWLMSVSARVCIVMLKMRQGFIAPIENVTIDTINTE